MRVKRFKIEIYPKTLFSAMCVQNQQYIGSLICLYIVIDSDGNNILFSVAKTDREASIAADLIACYGKFDQEVAVRSSRG